MTTTYTTAAETKPSGFASAEEWLAEAARLDAKMAASGRSALVLAVVAVVVAVGSVVALWV